MSTAVVAGTTFATLLLVGHAARPRTNRAVTPRMDLHDARVVATAPASVTTPGRRRRTFRGRLGPTMLSGAVVAILAGPILAAIVLTAGLLRPRWNAARTRRRHAAAVVADFPDFVDLLVLSIRSGCTPAQAIRTMLASAPASMRDAVAAVDDDINDGGRFADAVVQLPRHIGDIARPLADALALADRHGTPLGPILDRLADESRAQRRRAAEVSARQLPIRLSFPLVGCTLPSFVLLTIVPLMAGTLSSLPGISR